MNKLVELLKAERIGVGECRKTISRILVKNKPRIVTVNGQPRQVLVPYEAMVNLLEELAGYATKQQLRRAS